MAGWHMGRRWGRGHGRPRRIRRFVEPAVLLLLHAGPNHGYGILAGLSELGLEDYPTDASVVYRVLHDLEEQGMVVSSRDSEESAGPPRRVYSLTAAGDAYLAGWVEDLRQTAEVLGRFLEAYDSRHGEREHWQGSGESSSDTSEGDR